MESALRTLINALFCGRTLLSRSADVPLFAASETSQWLGCHLCHLSVFLTAICRTTSLMSCLQHLSSWTCSRCFVYPRSLCRINHLCGGQDNTSFFLFFFQISRWHLIKCVYSSTTYSKCLSFLFAFLVLLIKKNGTPGWSLELNEYLIS